MLDGGGCGGGGKSTPTVYWSVGTGGSAGSGNAAGVQVAAAGAAGRGWDGGAVPAPRRPALGHQADPQPHVVKALYTPTNVTNCFC